jgi:hypothetical protein
LRLYLFEHSVKNVLAALKDVVVSVRSNQTWIFREGLDGGFRPSSWLLKIILGAIAGRLVAPGLLERAWLRRFAEGFGIG